NDDNFVESQQLLAQGQSRVAQIGRGETGEEEEEEDVVFNPTTGGSSRDNAEQQDIIERVASAAVQLATALFVVLVYIFVSHFEFTLFTWHPVLMSIFLALATNGTMGLQNASYPLLSRRRLKYRHIHISMLGVASLVGISGIVVIIIDKSIEHASHFSSLHSSIGFTVFGLLIFQILIAISFLWLGPLRPYSAPAFHLHRIIGYLTLTLAWVNAIIAVNFDFIRHMEWHVPSFVWILIVMVIFISIFPRINVHKLGVSST
ncbi:hypothetical protein EV182_003506, partial [Spiromyces aspiralis]